MRHNNYEKEVLIIIPAYNERGNIEKLISQLRSPEITEIADVLVMNDASTDGTNHAINKDNVAVVTHVFNLGYGSGLQLGYKYAIRRGYKYVIQMDADGQHDPCNVLNIYERLKTPDAVGKYPDIVLGSRFVEGSSPYQMSKLRRTAVRMFGFLIYLVTGKKINDPTSGLQGLSRRTTLYYSKYNGFDDRYPDANMIMQMLLLGFRIEEVPAVMHQRVDGVGMHHGFKTLVYMFRMALSILAVLIRIKILKLEKNVANHV